VARLKVDKKHGTAFLDLDHKNRDFTEMAEVWAALTKRSPQRLSPATPKELQKKNAAHEGRKRQKETKDGVYLFQDLVPFTGSGGSNPPIRIGLGIFRGVGTGFDLTFFLTQLQLMSDVGGVEANVKSDCRVGVGVAHKSLKDW
jgi:hypothetical protein